VTSRLATLTVAGETDATPSAALARMQRFVDPGSLHLLRTRVRSRALGERAHDGDGVLTGLGAVGGRPVACYAQDARVSGGSLGEAQADAIVRLLGIAKAGRLPVVSFLESAGARVHEGVASLAGYARIFHQIVALSGTVPQISIVCGVCAGGAAYAPALTDITVMTESAAMFLTGPRIVRDVCGEDVTIAELGGARVHRGTGVCQLVARDADEASAQARCLLGFLRPAEGAGAAVADDDERPDPGAVLPARSSSVYDVREVVRAVADDGEFVELDARWARNMVTGFARLGKRSVGIVANQPRHIGGVLDSAASDKAARFVTMCDTFRVPLVVLVDTPGYMPGTRQEGEGIIRRGAAVVHAFSAARVPRVTVVLRKAFGGAYIAMNSAELGASLVYAWPDAEIGVMDPRSAVGLVRRREIDAAADPEALLAALEAEYRQEHCAAVAAARGGFVDEVIEPTQTRSRLIAALAALGGPERRDAVSPAAEEGWERALALAIPVVP
jgi:acetyl-CoA carboxylase carboxyltransferase component